MNQSIKKLSVLTIALICAYTSAAQHIGGELPVEINKSEKYLFYLHGGVVTVLGNNAVNQSMPEWGPYEYLNILDSLRARGYNVISENRKEGVDDSAYVNKIEGQIRSLINAGEEKNIIVTGASAGAHIALQVSAKLANSKIKYVILGACWPETYKDYLRKKLYGHFLSLIERTDPHGTCNGIFQDREEISSFSEITLNTGLSHGFMYKGYKEWIDPIVQWDSVH